MDTMTIRSAHPDSSGRGAISHRILCFFGLLLILLSVSIRPVSARPASRSLSDLDGINKIRIPVGVSDGALAWGDYDNDGDLDLLASGTTSAGTGLTTILTNDNGTFAENPLGLAQVQASSAAWGDYDNDGFLDVLLSGYVRVESGINVIGFAGVFHNEASGGGRTFVLKQTLPNIYWGSGTWGDYNNDGKMDILLTGYTDGAVPFARMYRNSGDYGSSPIIFEDTAISITPVGFSATAWSDFDKNGYFDFAISGKTAGGSPITQVYRNNQDGTFVVINLTGLWDGTVNFIDYDIDGYPDLLVTGNTGADITPNIHPTTILYRYNHSDGNFVEVPGTGLPNIWNSSVSIGDANNDGYPDIALAGKALAEQPMPPLPNQVYVNHKDGTFTNADAGLPDGAGRVLAWGDYNGDHTLDLALSGVPVTDPGTNQETYYTYFYPNTPNPSGNNPPKAPVMSAACWDGGNRLTLNWLPASDTKPDSTPLLPTSLTYNVRMGANSNGQNLVSPASDLSTGYHRLPGMGNTYNATSAVFLDLPNGTYDWSVQAVDAAYTGGPFDTTLGREINLGTRVAVDDTFGGIATPIEDNQNNVVLNILSNDLSGGPGSLSIFAYTNPSHGTLIRSNNILHYTPNSPYEGNDSFTYYAIRDDSLYCSLGTVNITLTQHNDAPTDINLTNNLVANGSPSGTLVGRLSTIDPDIKQAFTYTLNPINDYSAFNIVGNQLYTNTVVDYSTKSSYTISVRSTDNGGLYFEKVFTINVIQGHAPTDISLNETTVLEHQNTSIAVGQLTTTDPDTGDNDTATYTLVPDENNNNYDNDLFYIASGGTRLWTNAVFDYNTRNSYQVRIRSTDRGGLFFEKVFTITILPTIPSLSWLDSSDEHPNTEPPPAIVMSEDGVNGYGQLDPFHLTLLATDPGNGETLQWSISSQANPGTAVASGTTSGDKDEKEKKEIAYIPALNWNSDDGRGNDHFTVRVTDSGGNYAELVVAVTVKAVNDPPLFDPINDQQYDLPGWHSITITGINPGPSNESGQSIQLVATCPSYNNYNCDSSQVTNLSFTPVQANGTATFSFVLGPGLNNKNFAIIVAAKDGQPLKNDFHRNFWITIGTWTDFYLPFLSK
jgi:hypothetical protein